MSVIRWNGMSLEPIFLNHCLDRAVTATAYEMLPFHNGLRPELAKRVCAQVEELANLASGSQPDYNDPVTTVLYSTWYQLGQVNLAIGIARRLINNWEDRFGASDPIKILDIGSGTFALPIAFDTLRGIGDLTRNVTIHAIEKSREMEYCGRRIMQEYRRRWPTDPDYPEVSLVFGERPDDEFKRECFFTIVHALYPGIEATVGRFVNALAPPFGVCTANYRKTDQLEQLGAECFRNYKPDDFELPEPMLKYGMPLTLSFRQWLLRWVFHVDPSLGQRVSPLLGNRNLTTLPKAPIVKTYSRLQNDDGEGLPW